MTARPSRCPEMIEAENFDNGGEGVGYHDLSSQNSGGDYRATGVDIDAAVDSGGGYNVGWAFACEWLAYTVNVATAGTYDIEARVASEGSGGTFHIEVNGVDLQRGLSLCRILAAGSRGPRSGRPVKA